MKTLLVLAGLSTLLAFPVLSSAQETDPIPGLGLPSFDVSVPDIGMPQFDPPSMDFDVGPSDIEDALAEAHEALASGISEALVTTAAGISEDLDPEGDDGDPFSGISKVLHDVAMAIIRKIGG